MKRITKETDSYDYYTRIIPIGADGLTITDVNDGKNYLENYQYSNKVLTYIWKDESYTDAQTLMEDAEAKLQELSTPVETYSCDIIDLARQRKDYSILSYSLGDEIRLINRETRTLTKRRITKIIEYPENPEKNSCEFSNVSMTFTEMQEKLKKSSDIVNYVISSDGTYSGAVKVSDILNFESGIANSATLQAYNKDLAVLQQTIAEIEKNVGNIGNLSLTYAELGKANIPDAWVDAEMVDITDVTDAIFSNVIMNAQFVDAYLQNPQIVGAIIDADQLTVAGIDVAELLEKLTGEGTSEQRLTALEEKVTSIIDALKNVIADEAVTDTTE